MPNIFASVVQCLDFVRIDNTGNKLDEIAERAAHNFDGVGGVCW